MTATAPAAIRRLYETCRRRCRTLAAVKVLDYLYWCLRRFGRATPSRAQIAAATGYTERTVTRAVGELEGAGALRVWRDRPHCTDGTWRRARTNLYRLTWPPRDPSPLVAPKGHGCHVKALYSDRTVAAATSGAAAPPLTLDTMTPEPEPLPDLEPDPDPERLTRPSAPPWVTEGVTLNEWLARNRARA